MFLTCCGILQFILVAIMSMTTITSVTSDSNRLDIEAKNFANEAVDKVQKMAIGSLENRLGEANNAKSESMIITLVCDP